jgi:hypothetical protein
MHNLKINFDKFFNITKSVFKGRLNQSDNFSFYPNKPKLSDCEIIALSVTGESLGIDSESACLKIMDFGFSISDLRTNLDNFIIPQSEISNSKFFFSLHSIKDYCCYSLAIH